MFNRVFIIDFKRLVQLLLPTFLRKPKTVAWLQGITAPLRVLYADFTNNRAANIYKLSHNGQVCYLRKVLNDTFDPSLRRIKIVDGNRFQREYIYTEAEQQPKYLGTIYLRQSGDYSDSGVDFRVLVPDGFDIARNFPQMRATIDFYRLASKRYKIQYENE